MQHTNYACQNRQSGGNRGIPEGYRREGHWRDSGAFIRSLCNAPNPTPATQKITGRVAETKGHRRDIGGMPRHIPDPFAIHQVRRLSCKSHWQSGGDQGPPENHRREIGRLLEVISKYKSNFFRIYQVPRLQSRKNLWQSGGVRIGCKRCVRKCVLCIGYVCVYVSNVCVSVCCIWDI